MHRSLTFVARAAVLVAASVGGARVARAEDPPLPGGRLPKLALKDVALVAADLPEGWRLAPAEPALAEEKALREGIATVAASAREPDVAPLTVSLLAKEGQPVVVALVASQRDPAAFAAAAKAAAATQGWAFRELGTPSRIVLVLGPEGLREQALAAETAVAVRFFAKHAAEALDAWRAGKGPPVPAYVFSELVLRIDPQHAPSHLIKGDMIVRMAQNGNPDAHLEDAVTHLRAALAKEATSPLAADLEVEARGLLGETLLSLEPPKNEEARDALLAAVARLDGSKVRADVQARFRYNLACAHGRLKENDAAFALLGALLDAMAQAPAPQLEAIWRTDADFRGLQADARWEALLKKHPAPAPPVKEPPGEAPPGKEPPPPR